MRHKAYTHAVITEAVEAAIFHFLCVLDGVSAIEDIGEKGRLELYYISPTNEKVLLNDPNQEDLHDLVF